jgi:hypothetical protein
MLAVESGTPRPRVSRPPSLACTFVVTSVENLLGPIRFGRGDSFVACPKKAKPQSNRVPRARLLSSDLISRLLRRFSHPKLDHKLMPPPKYAPIRKRRSKRPEDFGSSQDQQQATSQPSTPLLEGKVSRSKRSVQRRQTCTSSAISIGPANTQQNGDSDSDTACGFDSAWRGSAQL